MNPTGCGLDDPAGSPFRLDLVALTRGQVPEAHLDPAMQG